MTNKEKAERVKNFTRVKIQRLLSSSSTSAYRASLARLRRGIGHAPGEIPEIWGEYLLGLDEELMGSGEQPSPAEWAIYVAMTMFAHHQQGKSEPMHVEEKQSDETNRFRRSSLGTAAGSLIENEDDRQRVARRFNPIATSKNLQEMSQHLRSLISQLRTNNIPLDYGRLAYDLYRFQDPKTINEVRRTWGEDFYCNAAKKETNSNE